MGKILVAYCFFQDLVESYDGRLGSQLDDNGQKNASRDDAQPF